MKISSIQLQNLGAVSSFEADLSGGHIIATAENGEGKTTALRGLIDRMRSIKKDKNLKIGEKNGWYNMVFSDGSAIKWQFTEKTENIEYYDPEGQITGSSVIKDIGAVIFGKPFDIDKFLRLSETEKYKKLQELSGIDLSSLDIEYSEKFVQRTEVNRQLKALRASKITNPQYKGDPLEALQEKYKNVAKLNNDAEAEFLKKKAAKIAEIDKVNAVQKKTLEATAKQQKKKAENIENAQKELELIRKELERCTHISRHFATGVEAAEKAIKAMPTAYKVATFNPLQYPEFVPPNPVSMDSILADIELCKKQTDYDTWKKKGLDTAAKSEQLTEELQEILQRKKEAIQNSNLPKEFSFSEDGKILYNEMAFSDSTMSLSEKYIAGLKLGQRLLGKLQAMHFEASALSPDSIKKVVTWANSVGLQLLLERPRRDGESKGITHRIF